MKTKNVRGITGIADFVDVTLVCDYRPQIEAHKYGRYTGVFGKLLSPAVFFACITPDNACIFAKKKSARIQPVFL